MELDRIANEIIQMWHITKSNKVSFLLKEVGYSPISAYTALWDAQDAGKIKLNEKRDTLKVSEGVDPAVLAVSEGMRELTTLLEKFVGHIARNESDLLLEQAVFEGLIPGATENKMKQLVLINPHLDSYTLTDPKDKKSDYTFITLKENADKQWGKRRFKSAK